MKTSPLKIPALTLGFSLLSVASFGAQPVPTPARVVAPLGLLRLQDAAKPGDERQPMGSHQPMGSGFGVWGKQVKISPTLF